MERDEYAEKYKAEMEIKRHSTNEIACKRKGLRALGRFFEENVESTG